MVLTVGLSLCGRKAAPVGLVSSSFIKFVAIVRLSTITSSLSYLVFSLTAYTFQAQALSKVQDYKGQCVLELSPNSISVKVVPCLDSSSENRDLGTWPFDCIRRFNTQVSLVKKLTEVCEVVKSNKK